MRKVLVLVVRACLVALCNTIFAFTGANQVTLLSPTIDNSQWMIGANLVQAL